MTDLGKEPYLCISRTEMLLSLRVITVSSGSVGVCVMNTCFFKYQYWHCVRHQPHSC